jgi:hypothetical protein
VVGRVHRSGEHRVDHREHVVRRVATTALGEGQLGQRTPIVSDLENGHPPIELGPARRDDGVDRRRTERVGRIDGLRLGELPGDHGQERRSGA